MYGRCWRFAEERQRQLRRASTLFQRQPLCALENPLIAIFVYRTTLAQFSSIPKELFANLPKLWHLACPLSRTSLIFNIVASYVLLRCHPLWNIAVVLRVLCRRRSTFCPACFGRSDCHVPRFTLIDFASTVLIISLKTQARSHAMLNGRGIAGALPY